MMTDPIADMLTRVRNAYANGAEHVTMPYSNTKLGIAKVLKKEGYISDYGKSADSKQGVLRVYLKYGPDGERMFNRIKRVSKPGRRIYKKFVNLVPVVNGMGIVVVSTSRGILSDRDCRKLKLGGEVLCEVW